MSGVLAGELLRIAARLAVAAVPDIPALCLDEAETLIRARDLVTCALAARVERVHVTGEAKAHGHASTSTWLRWQTTSPPADTTTPGATTPGTTDPGATDLRATDPSDTVGSPAADSPEVGPQEGGPYAAGPGGTRAGRIGPGMTRAGAARMKRIAVELGRLPLVRERFAAGLLSEGSVEAITAVTAKLSDEHAAQAEPILAKLADTASSAEVAKAGRYLRELLNPGTLDKECDDDYAARFLQLRQSPTGGVEGEFRLPREAAAALVEFMTAYARPKDKDDDRPLRVRQADAFAALLTKKVSTELLVLVRAESMPDDVPAAPDTDNSSDTDPQQDADPQQDEDGTWQDDDLRQDDDPRQETAHNAHTPDEPPTATPDPTPNSATGPTPGPTTGPATGPTICGDPPAAGTTPACNSSTASPSTGTPAGPEPTDAAATDNAVATGDPATEPGQPAKPAGPAKPTEPGQAVGPAKPIPTPALQPDTETHQPDPPRPPEEHSRQQAPPGGTSPPGHDHPQPDPATRAGTGTGVGSGTRTDTGAGVREDTGGSAGTEASPDACRTCGHAPDRLAPGLLIATGHLLPISDIHRLARTSRLTRLVINTQG
ncbi:DUF222 domain-containing protein, partial [Microbispora sp. NPDC049125]|uniref:DUF222 domain-containing protein n=1 Tax=Microbispora sp. NPDC049125 TaxID=3154929 RepID=UPI0034661DAC